MTLWIKYYSYFPNITMLKIQLYHTNKIKYGIIF